MSYHKNLLSQARHLAKREPRKPTQASLRRSVSAAYYALFHLLIDQATRLFLAGNNRESMRQCLARAFAHSSMKEAAKGFAARNVSSKILPALEGLPIQPELARLASAFVDLQQARHDADYYLGRQFTRQEAHDICDQADQAFSDWNIIRGTRQSDVFLLSLLAQKHIQS